MVSKIIFKNSKATLLDIASMETRLSGAYAEAAQRHPKHREDLLISATWRSQLAERETAEATGIPRPPVRIDAFDMARADQRLAVAAKTDDGLKVEFRRIQAIRIYEGARLKIKHPIEQALSSAIMNAQWLAQQALNWVKRSKGR